jgi:hypothetical protein
VKDQSVTQVNSIRPSLSGSRLANGEPLTVRTSQTRPNSGRRNDPQGGTAAATVTQNGNVVNRASRNGSKVVGDGMVGKSIEISRETCQFQIVDSPVEKQGSEERCLTNVPGPQACNRRPRGTKPRLRRTTGRSGWQESEAS